MGPVAMAIATGSSSIPLTLAVRALFSRYCHIRAKVSVEFDVSIKVGDVRMRVTKGSPSSLPGASASERERDARARATSDLARKP
jgi:hypothetical protein